MRIFSCRLTSFSLTFFMHNINLIGYRCSGKSSVGKKLAEVLRCQFVDADVVFVEQTAALIADFVVQFGWPEFRQVESRILGDLCRQDNIVLATGGGVVLSPGNRRKLQASGVNFWLQVNLETVLDRLPADTVSATQRPALTALSLEDEISAGLKERELFYREVSDHTIIVDNLSVSDIVAQILLQYESNDRSVG
jgi:shikimate kinase